MFNAMDGSMKKLSVPELVQIAQGMGGDPAMQFSAVQELDLRRRANAQPQPQQKTVLEGMADQAMAAPPSGGSAAPGDPVASGIASIIQQQQMAAGGPQRMADGGLVRRMQSIMETLGQGGEYVTEGTTPDEARDLVAEFMPDNTKSYEEADLRAKNSDAAARQSRNSNLWLALAQGGLGLADRGRWADALPAFSSAQQAISGFNDQLNRNEDRRSRTGEQRRAEGNDRGARGLAALLQSRGEASEERRSLRRDAAGIAEVEARLAQDRDQVRQLAAQLLEANQGQMVQDGESETGTPGADPVPFLRPYNQQDALSDAIALVSGGGRRSGGAAAQPDDLSELRSMLSDLADPMKNGDANSRARAIQQLEELAASVRQGPINRNLSERRSPTGARAPSEPGYMSRAREQAAEYQRQRPSAAQPDGTIRDLNGNPVR